MKQMMKLNNEQNKVINSSGHLLVTGGPGSGKTMTSILKAGQLTKKLEIGQKVLFLSFARASVARIEESIEEYQSISNEQKEHISVETYHSFFWKIIKSHGYLIGLPKVLEVLTKSSEAVALAETISKFTTHQKDEKIKAVNTELCRISIEEGKICFDFFAKFVNEILYSNRIRDLINNKYPFIILDEFQDTDSEQWDIMKKIGKKSFLIALADPEQRIYGFKGADPKRLEQFCKYFSPKKIDFGTANYRSSDTDIAKFADDLMNHKVSCNYNNVSIYTYKKNLNDGIISIKKLLDASCDRVKDIKDWSIAVLVPTKKMTRLVSEAFTKLDIEHSAVIDFEAAILSAEIIACLLQPHSEYNLKLFVKVVCSYLKGRGGASPTKCSINRAKKILQDYNDQKNGKTIRKGSVGDKVILTYNNICCLNLTGNPDNDWVTICQKLEKGNCKDLKDAVKDVKNIRLLGVGNELRQRLSADWLENEKYLNALSIVQEFYINDSLSTNGKAEKGIVIMNMHKSKGKQFDEVIIFEGCPNGNPPDFHSNSDRIVYGNVQKQDITGSLYNMRVSATRGKRHVSILTPKINPCILLLKK